MQRAFLRMLGAGLLLALANAQTARADDPPTPIEEYLRLDTFAIPLQLDSRELWILTPSAAFVVDGQERTREYRDGSGFTGAPTTFGSTTKGWLLGTTDGVWEVRLNDRDLLFLPELEEEGVYRFEGDVAFTNRSVYRLSTPWERYEFKDFGFRDVNGIHMESDTLTLATRKGLRRLLFDLRAWDDAQLGDRVEKEKVVRFLMPDSHYEVAAPETFDVRTRALLVGERRVFYYDAASKQWIHLEGLTFPKFRASDSDSAYRKIPDVMFQAASGTPAGDPLWRRWLLTPTGVCRLEMPDLNVPSVSAQFPLEGDARATFVDSVFAWVGTTEDLYCIDQEYEDTYRFFDERGMFVWGILGWPSEITYDVKGEERGWYLLTKLGMAEVFQESWSWDTYGFDDFQVGAIRDATDDVDGFWVGTTRGLRWFSVVDRKWDRARVPEELQVDTVIHKLEWHGNDLYALAENGLFMKTRHSRAWVKVAASN